MGQYWNAIVEKEKFNPRDYDSFSKLTEHSYIGNNYCEAVCFKIKNTPKEIVWIGDYADLEDIVSHKNKKFLKFAYRLHWKPEDAEKFSERVNMRKGFLVNVDKKEYLSLEKYCDRVWDKTGSEDFTINPLPLLTAFPGCNGRGGGDYFSGEDIEYVGYWAGDHIMFTENTEKVTGFQEILSTFVEE